MSSLNLLTTSLEEPRPSRKERGKRRGGGGGGKGKKKKGGRRGASSPSASSSPSVSFSEGDSYLGVSDYLDSDSSDSSSSELSVSSDSSSSLCSSDFSDEERFGVKKSVSFAPGTRGANLGGSKRSSSSRQSAQHLSPQSSKRQSSQYLSPRSSKRQSSRALAPQSNRDLKRQESQRRSSKNLQRAGTSSKLMRADSTKLGTGDGESSSRNVTEALSGKHARVDHFLELGGKLNPFGTLIFVKETKRKMIDPCGACGLVSEPFREPDFFRVYAVLGRHEPEEWCTNCSRLALGGEKFQLKRGKATSHKIELVPINFSTFTFCSWEVENNSLGSMVANLSGITNRMVVLRVPNTHTKSLAREDLIILNPVQPSDDGEEPFAAIRRLEKSSQSKVKFIIVTEDSKIPPIIPYLVEFPHAIAHIPAGRIHRLLETTEFSTGQNYDAILNNERVEFFDAAKIHADMCATEEGTGVSAISLCGLREANGPKGPYHNYPLSHSQQLVYAFEETRTLWNGTSLFSFFAENDQHPPGKLLQRAIGLKRGTIVNFLKPKADWVKKSKCPAVVEPAVLEVSVKKLLASDFDRMGDFHTGLNIWAATGREQVGDLFDWVLDRDKWVRFGTAVDYERYRGPGVFRGEQHLSREREGPSRASSRRLEKGHQKSKRDANIPDSDSDSGSDSDSKSESKSDSNSESESKSDSNSDPGSGKRRSGNRASKRRVQAKKGKHHGQRKRSLEGKRRSPSSKKDKGSKSARLKPEEIEMEAKTSSESSWEAPRLGDDMV